MGQPAAEKPDSPWLTTTEAAAYCRMSKGALLQHIARGDLVPDSRARPGIRVHRFRRETLDRWLTGEKHGR